MDEQHANEGYEPRGADPVPPAVFPGQLRQQLAEERGGDVAAAGAGASPGGHSGETGNALDADVDGAGDGDQGDEELKGDALDAAVKEYNIEGASTMSADQKRQAVADAKAKAEAEQS